MFSVFLFYFSQEQLEYLSLKTLFLLLHILISKNPHQSGDLPIRTDINYSILKRLHKAGALDEYPIYGQNSCIIKTMIVRVIF